MKDLYHFLSYTFFRSILSSYVIINIVNYFSLSIKGNLKFLSFDPVIYFSHETPLLLYHVANNIYYSIFQYKTYYNI